MRKTHPGKILSIVALILSATLVPTASYATTSPTLTVSTTTPILNKSVVTVTATGLVPGQLYEVKALASFFAFPLANVTADQSGAASLSHTWSLAGSDFCQPGSENACQIYNVLVGLFRSKIILCPNSCSGNSPVAESPYLYAGQNNKMGNWKISGPGYQDGKFIQGESIHVSISNVGSGAVNGLFGACAAPTLGNGVDAFWDAVDESGCTTLFQGQLINGAYEGDFTLSDVPDGNLQIQFFYGSLDSLSPNPGQALADQEAGLSVVLESAAGNISSTPPAGINSITRAKAWAVVDFTLPQLQSGKYDRVAYSVDGGPWTNWGLYAKSTQVIKGLKAGKTYSVRIRAHVKNGPWTPASDSVTIKM